MIERDDKAGLLLTKIISKDNLELHCEYMGLHNPKAIGEVLDMVKLSDRWKGSWRFFPWDEVAPRYGPSHCDQAGTAHSG